MERIEDSLYMERALELARKGYGLVSPNPMVGAVIVKNGKVIGEGYHHRFGGPHAEVCAVDSVDSEDDLRGATIYVTLEPCSHYGKTPPCAELLVAKGFGRVVVGCVDPNERVAGRGIAMLRAAGIEVCAGVLEEKCKRLNEKFFTAHTLRRPYVLLKWACSADGYLDRRRNDGDQPAARLSTSVSSLEVQHLRQGYDAIMVGAGTVIVDNPRLTLRGLPGKDPARVVVDRRGRVAADARVFAPGKVIYFSSFHRNDLPEHVEQEVVAEDCGVATIIKTLFERHGVTSVIVEGGADLLRSVIESGCWDKARVEVSRDVFGAEGVARMAMPQGVVSFAESDGNVVVMVKNDE